MTKEKLPIVEEELDEHSRWFLTAFNKRGIQAAPNLQMERRQDGTCALFVTIPSPTSDRRRLISLWLDEKRIPTLQFGAWHTHADLWDRIPESGLQKMLDYLERIINGEIVLTEFPTVGNAIPHRVLDMAEPDDVLDMLTDPDEPSDMNLLSWSGYEDDSLNDLRGRPHNKPLKLTVGRGRPPAA